MISWNNPIKQQIADIVNGYVPVPKNAVVGGGG
jgi:hypothetical protein